MYVEDLLYLINDKGISDANTKISLTNIEKRYVFNLLQNQEANKGLTEHQRNLAIKILRKNSKLVSTVLNTDVNLFLKNPEFKLPIFRQQKLVALEEINGEKKIVLKFPYNLETIEMIKQHQRKYFYVLGSQAPYFNAETKQWRLGLTESNLLFLNKLKLNFTVDEELLLLNDLVNKIADNPLDHIPIIAFDTHYYLKNIADSVPKIKTTNLAEALIHAQKYGIHDWNDLVQQHIDNDSSIKILEPFFKKDLNYSINLTMLSPFIPYCKKLLFVLPQDQELQYITKIYEFLTKQGVESSEISVLSKKPIIKNYIHENVLSKKINDQTRFMITTNPISNFLNNNPQNFDFVLYGGIDRQFSRKKVKKYFNKNFNSVWFNI